MKAEIKVLEEKRLVGMSLEMTLTENKTPILFREFMPRRKEIPLASLGEVYDLREYDQDYYRNFNPNNRFKKWALVEVSGVGDVPEGMEVFELSGGTYAVFFHKGHDEGIFQQIFGQWLPSSDYELDHRPHFEVFKVSAIPNDPDAEQHICIPVRLKE